MFTDTHCHLNDERFTDEKAVIEAFRAASVDFVINVGYDLASSGRAAETAKNYGDVYFAAGIHPDSTEQATDKGLEIISDFLSDPKCVALGEIGLDYHYEGYDKDAQKEAFIKQLEIAAAAKLPISVHGRDCTEDMLKILKDNKDKLAAGGVMHCFGGSVETAKEILKLGMYISFAGTVTFKNAANVQRVAEYVPFDRFLTETDSPYLAPHPLRGQVNTPANVGLVARKIAEIKNQDVMIVAERAKLNAKTLFKKIK